MLCGGKLSHILSFHAYLEGKKPVFVTAGVGHIAFSVILFGVNRFMIDVMFGSYATLIRTG